MQTPPMPARRPTRTDTPPDLRQPRTIAEVLSTALTLYLRHPIVFLALALVVVAPYDLIVLAATQAAPLGQQSVSASTVTILALVDFALIGPLVSALEMQVLEQLGRHEEPRLSQVIASGVRVLPVVAAAEIIAGIGIGIGLVAFIVPGVVLALRWAVVAQVAAVEGTDWPGALRRSGELTSRNYLRIFALLVIVALINLALGNGAAQLTGTGNGAAQVALGIAIGTITRSFQALVVAVLYYDLRARGSTT